MLGVRGVRRRSHRRGSPTAVSATRCSESTTRRAEVQYVEAGTREGERPLGGLRDAVHPANALTRTLDTLGRIDPNDRIGMCRTIAFICMHAHLYHKIYLTWKRDNLTQERRVNAFLLEKVILMEKLK